MSALAERQRSLLRRIKGREDGEATGVSHGQPHLEMLREVMLWWRRLELGRYCRFTVALLQRRGDFALTVEGFVRASTGSPFIEEQARLFLDYLAGDADPLVAAMAASECALIRSRREPEFTTAIAWRHDPAMVFAHVLRGESLDETAAAGCFELRVGASVPGGLEWSAAALSAGR